MYYKANQRKIFSKVCLRNTAASASIDYIDKILLLANESLFGSSHLRYSAASTSLVKKTCILPVSVFALLASLVFVCASSTSVNASPYIQDAQNSVQQFSALSLPSSNSAASLYLRFRKGNSVEQPRKLKIC